VLEIIVPAIEGLGNYLRVAQKRKTNNPECASTEGERHIREREQRELENGPGIHSSKQKPRE
jgi:hypothetical protein